METTVTFLALRSSVCPNFRAFHLSLNSFILLAYTIFWNSRQSMVHGSNLPPVLNIKFYSDHSRLNMSPCPLLSLPFRCGVSHPLLMWAPVLGHLINWLAFLITISLYYWPVVAKCPYAPMYKHLLHISHSIFKTIHWGRCYFHSPSDEEL